MIDTIAKWATVAGVTFLASAGLYYLAIYQPPQYCFDEFVNPMTGE